MGNWYSWPWTAGGGMSTAKKYGVLMANSTQQQGGKPPVTVNAPSGSASNSNWGSIGAAAIGGLIDIGTAGGSGLFNAKQAKMNREFQRDMYASRWQMSMADMKAAGLNPILAAQGGLGGPGGGVSGSAAQMNPPAGVGGQAARNIMQAKLMKSQLANLAADTYKKQMEGGHASSQAYHEQTRELGTQIMNKASALGLTKVLQDEKILRENPKLRAFKTYLDLVLQGLTGASSAKGLMK